MLAKSHGFGDSRQKSADCTPDSARIQLGFNDKVKFEHHDALSFVRLPSH
jgi:hypothetical protein